MTLFSSLLSKVAIKDKENSTHIKHPKKKHPQGSSRYTLRQSLKNKLAAGTVLRDSVKCPENEDENEWIAMLVIESYNNMINSYEFIQQFCTDQTCPQMNGAKAVYYWTEGKGKPQELPAHQYIDKLTNWINEQIDNPDIFPVGGSNFSKTFKANVSKIISRMLRVYAHIYYAHWEHIKTLNVDGHVNTLLKHLQYFAEEFGLIGEKDKSVMKHVFDTL
ncbi:Mob1-like protein [Tieghemostelium lacteum]|uniref:Mob1-like protein n=1 Tax=Tieghemostelium lacteum TaxID=361077 RepID=A0A151ZAF3_TIELA|nr:Mob1-like protein [Tieghemostelium lacteum]|eukprot:KYQ90874.1 Mob1-like protein [Tieghemostelium lacteum]